MAALKSKWLLRPPITEEALKTFAEIEKQHGLSTRAILAVDLRVPDRVVVRLTEEAAAQHNESVVQRIKKAGGRV